MAVFVRSPRDYVGLLGHAFSRAGIPGWFDRGTGRPHPSGRAFLALLGCAVERLSAARFAEYLSLSQVPEASPAAASAIPPPADDLFSGFTAIESPPDEPDPGTDADANTEPASSPSEASARPIRADPNAEPPSVVDGTLRAPWKWETLIVESAVIGGDPQRWHRRLAGLAEEYRQKALGRGSRGSRFAAAPAPRAGRAQPRAPSRLRAAGDRRARVLACLGDVGRLAHAVRGARAAAFSESPRACCASSPSCGRWAPSAPCRSRKSATSSRIGSVRSRITRRRIATARCSSAARTRRAAGRSGSSSFPDSPSGCFRRSRAKIRCCSTRRCARRWQPGCRCRRTARKTERLLLRLAVGAATERLWLSYPRIDVAGSAAARAIVLRARRHARDHRPHPQPRSAAAAGTRSRAAQSWTGRRRRGRRTRSTISSTISRRCGT